MENFNKIIHVPAFFRPIGKNVKVKVPTGETKLGLFGKEKPLTREEVKWERTGWSDTQIDSNRLSKDLEEAVNKLNRDGYEVVTVTPVLNGAYNFKFNTEKNATYENHTWGYGYGYGYGYSYTDSLIITAKKISIR